ncbi:hypothetical protein FH972_009290 [Carpinus fangiana]|uniref:Uncharacterized protein n=1 Tax=Carpinus fangiana TaxID=176857 RepID=A0A5N6R4D8_9ROSI|nr:hypothetical protein FH972_009290 [Carpinus fangiana]
MKVDVQLISSDTIKPSSSTPDNLRHHTLSFIDQIAPSIFMPLLLFYPTDIGVAHLSNEERQTRIKESLAEALTRFYLLAGRIKDNFLVDCNDEGVHYVEAKATCKLAEFLEDLNPAEHNKFLPYEQDAVNELAFNRPTHDLRLRWDAIARGSSNVATPLFESATIFPPVTVPSFIVPCGNSEKEKIAIKRFVFEGSTIAAPRDKYRTDDTNIEYPRPTRVEALSAFIYDHFLAATQPDPNKLYSLSHVANLRNECKLVVFHHILTPLRDAMKEVDVDYVKSFQESGGLTNFLVENLERFKKGEVTPLTFTSLCRFPIYEADFGWGKPLWVASARLQYKNLLGFFDTKSGSGIEAWINLDEEDMAKFEADTAKVSMV